MNSTASPRAIDESIDMDVDMDMDMDMDVDVDTDDAYVPSRHKKPAPHPTRGGEVSCLRCGALFQSWDRTRNRLCPACSNRKW